MLKYIAIFLILSAFSLKAQEGSGRYTFVFLNANPDREELPKAQVDSLQSGHMANIGRLVKARKMIAAGPFYTGGGIFIFDTNKEETDAVLNSDPAIAAGRFIIETIPFNMDMGQICDMWDKNEEDIEMTTYYIMRFTNTFKSDASYAAKTNRFTLNRIKEAEEAFNEIEFLGDLNFDGNQGQVVIFKGQENEEKTYEAFFKEHKLVELNMMDFYLKKLYFPKGIFCEN